MPLETATYLNGLVPTNPASTDSDSQGADHLRLIKATLLATFPALTGPVTASQVALNAAATAAATPGLITVPNVSGVSQVTLQGASGRGDAVLGNSGDNFALQIHSDSNGALPSQLTVGQNGAVAINGSSPSMAVGAGGGIFVGTTPVSFVGMIVLSPYGLVPTGWRFCDGTFGTPNLSSLAPSGTIYIQRVV